MNDLQDLIDALAAEIGRPVGLDDRQFRALAYSPHPENVDRVRLASILYRQAPEDVVAWLSSLSSIRNAKWFARVPANAALGMAERVCVPVRCQDLLLGYLWLIDAPEQLGDDQISAALSCAAEAGAILYQGRVLEDAGRARERELVRLLLTSDDAARAVAGEHLTSSGLLEPAACMCVAVVHATARADGLMPEAMRIRLGRAIEEVRRALPPHQIGAFVDARHAAAVVACPHAGESERRGRLILDRVRGALDAVEQPQVAVGISGCRDRLVDLRAAYDEALQAATLAGRVPELGPLAAWPSLGAYRTISQLLRGTAPEDAVPGSLTRLLESADAAVLIPTLHAYLERAGDAQATAKALYVHRSSLYNRLRRVQEIAGVDLNRGDDRLELHLGLRLWRMSRLDALSERTSFRTAR